MMNGPQRKSDGWISAVTDQDWEIVGDGDYNGDGHADVLWRNMENGQNYMYLMDGFTIIGGGNVMSEADQNWQIVNPP